MTSTRHRRIRFIPNAAIIGPHPAEFDVPMFFYKVEFSCAVGSSAIDQANRIVCSAQQVWWWQGPAERLRSLGVAGELP